ncbi:formin-like protein 5 isoform X2 [Drosophila ficusphila]|nr:formin-like protein 5 isoform X2 [Drosophila ficusphila]
MQVSSDVFAHPPPAVRPPPSYADNASTNASLDGMKSSSSSNSLDRYAGAPHTLAGPSFATSVLVSSKGSKYEISGPVNFQHVSGDVLRDRTRNAFDLNADSNDNVLRKYMMERGITEEDISHMRRQDVITKIVHSNFTWMPSKGDRQPKAQSQEPARPLLYATISTNNQITPPPSPPPPSVTNVSKPIAAPNFSNYASLTSRFVDISEMDLPAPTPVRQQEVGHVVPVQIQPEHVSSAKVPPPPSAVTARNTHGYPAAIDIRQVRPSAVPKVSNETYATIAPQRKAGTMRIPPPAPPKPTILPNTISTSSMGSLYAVSPVQHAKPPPPPPPVKPTARIPSAYGTPVATQNTKITGSQMPVPPPPPQAAAAVPPPPPPPMPVAAASGGAPPPPPPPPTGMAGVPPPPPMQKTQPMAAPAASSGGDSRDAFLESIRQGVTLKKVNQKAATISGIKPRPERKPATTDFLSELKLGITLRRVKNPGDNPYSEESESQA